MRLCSGVLGGLLVGVVAGAWLGAQYYIHLGPPWGQYGYEFEGVAETASGAAIGGLIGAAVGHVVPLRLRTDAAHEPRTRWHRVTVAGGWLSLYAGVVVAVLAVLTPAAALGWDRSTPQDRLVRALAAGLLACLVVWSSARIYRFLARRHERRGSGPLRRRHLTDRRCR